MMGLAPQRILAATDFSPAGAAALRVAAAIARRRRTTVDLVHVLDERARLRAGMEGVTAILARGDGKARERALAKLRKLAERAGSERVHLHVPSGDPAVEILALADRLRADLIVLGTRGSSRVRRMFLGSVADRVLRRQGVPLLLVQHAPAAGEFKRILVGVELHGERTPWLEAAAALARDLRGELLLLHVRPPKGYLSDARHVEIDPAQMERDLAGLAASFDRKLPVQVVLRRGDAADVIPSAARRLGADLVVLGAERHPDGWPGRVADRSARAGLPALLLVWPAGGAGRPNK